MPNEHLCVLVKRLDGGSSLVQVGSCFSKLTRDRSADPPVRLALANYLRFQNMITKLWSKGMMNDSMTSKLLANAIAFDPFDSTVKGH